MIGLFSNGLGTLVIAVVVIAGCFWGLMFAPNVSPDQRGGFFTILGVVVTYFFTKHSNEQTVQTEVTRQIATAKVNGDKLA